ncbi:MAG: type II secretion system protein N [Steroidobacteraceae bacterium]
MLTALTVAVVALPASIVTHFLPAAVHAEDFSGSVWHGSAGRITVNGRDAGALEWRLHCAALLHLHLVADLHWVKGGFVIDGTADAERGGLMASDIQGGGPIEDLRDFGLSFGWRGTAKVQVKELNAVFSGAQASVRSAVGDVAVSDLTLPQVAAGADLGGYSLHFADAAIAPDSDATAKLTDTGGPLALDAVIRFSVKERRGTLTGTVKERADAPAALHSQLDDLAQLHPRDTQGRIPLDLEFTL